jgi:sugar lactone lactonase YvrE
MKVSGLSYSGLGDVVCVAPTGDRCGEGVLWHPDEQAVYWTDINRFLIHRWTPRDSCVRSWFFDEPVTAVLLTDSSETLAVVLGSGVILWEPRSDARGKPFFSLENWPTVRLNDAGVDPWGALWVGSMRNNVNADGSVGEVGGTDGALYRIDPDGAAKECLRDIGISNTIVWSPDRTQFYFADSLADSIDVYEFDHGELKNPLPFLKNFGRGAPDGSTVDSEGCLWNCRYGGACIVRVAPGGAIDRIVEMPTANITNCTFGGEGLQTLYIATAALGASPGDRLAGGLFAMKTDVAGQMENRFRR